MTRPNQEHLTPSHQVDDCLVCRQTHIASTLTLLRAPCGCDVVMCAACQRSPATPEWLRLYASFCRICATDLAMQLSA